MIELSILFVLLLVTALIRYIAFGAFDPLMFAMIFLLPFVALTIFFH